MPKSKTMSVLIHKRTWVDRRIFVISFYGQFPHKSVYMQKSEKKNAICKHRLFGTQMTKYLNHRATGHLQYTALSSSSNRYPTTEYVHSAQCCTPHIVCVFRRLIKRESNLLLINSSIAHQFYSQMQNHEYASIPTRIKKRNEQRK